MAVRARFELAVGCYTYGSLANSWFKPAHPPHQRLVLYIIIREKKTINLKNKKDFFCSLKVLIIRALERNRIKNPKTQFIKSIP